MTEDEYRQFRHRLACLHGYAMVLSKRAPDAADAVLKDIESASKEDAAVIRQFLSIAESAWEISDYMTIGKHQWNDPDSSS